MELIHLAPTILDAAGVPADTAARTTALVERLVTLRYGSAAAESAEIAEVNAEVHAVADELEACLRRAES